MALLLSFPAALPKANRTATAATGTAEIVILPCVRRERMETDAAEFRAGAGEMQAQRQA